MFIQGIIISSSIIIIISIIYLFIYLFIYLEDGVLYAFGSDYWGCIGCNNELDEEVVTPYRVRFFDENPVEQVACGECHVVALTGGLPVSSGSWTKNTLMLSELTFL